jgi:hypothetical protein
MVLEIELKNTITPQRLSTFLRGYKRYSSTCGLHVLFMVKELKLKRDGDRFQITSGKILVDALDSPKNALIVCIHSHLSAEHHPDTHTFCVGRINNTNRYFIAQGYMKQYASSLVFYDTKEYICEVFDNIVKGMCYTKVMDKAVYIKTFFVEPDFTDCSDMTLTGSCWVHDYTTHL